VVPLNAEHLHKAAAVGGRCETEYLHITVIVGGRFESRVAAYTFQLLLGALLKAEY